MTALTALAVDGDGRTATVVACEGRDACVRLDSALVQARTALSCLVQPEPGDTVLAATVAGTTWVLAVLERDAGAPLRLHADGDLSIAAGGTLTLAAARSIDAHSPAARLSVDDALHVGRRLTAHVGTLRVIGDLLETVAEHVLLRARRSTRFIAESDQSRCGDIDHRADRTMSLRADTAFVTGKTLVRVDADQIHMG